MNFPKTTHTDLVDFPGFITEEGWDGEVTCLKSHMGRPVELDPEPPAPATRPTHMSLQHATPSTWTDCPWGKPHCKQLHCLGLQLVWHKSSTNQGLKMPNTLECGLWVKASWEKVGPNKRRVLCTGTIFVSEVPVNDVSPSTRANTAMFSSCILECNFKKCGNIQEKNGWQIKPSLS